MNVNKYIFTTKYFQFLGQILKSAAYNKWKLLSKKLLNCIICDKIGNNCGNSFMKFMLFYKPSP